jgi:chaperonin GroES
MNIRPLHDRVIVKRVEEQATSTGGIIIPEAAKRKLPRGTVVAVGNGKVAESGNVQPLTVKVGDVVIFGFGVQEIKIDNEDYLHMKESDIIGIVE